MSTPYGTCEDGGYKPRSAAPATAWLDPGGHEALPPARLLCSHSLPAGRSRMCHRRRPNGPGPAGSARPARSQPVPCHNLPWPAPQPGAAGDQVRSAALFQADEAVARRPAGQPPGA